MSRHIGPQHSISQLIRTPHAHKTLNVKICTKFSGEADLNPDLMAPPPVEDTSLITQISEASKYAYARRRPWSELFSTASFSRPRSLAEATDRVRRHLVYFRINYAFILLALVLCSLLREPFSLIVVLAVAVAWYALYFFRSEPLVILNQSFGDGAVLAGLTVATALALLLTGVAGTILTAVAVGFAIVVLHGALRASDDLFLDEEEATRGGVISSAGYNSLPANNSGRSF